MKTKTIHVLDNTEITVDLNEKRKYIQIKIGNYHITICSYTEFEEVEINVLDYDDQIAIFSETLKLTTPN